MRKTTAILFCLSPFFLSYSQLKTPSELRRTTTTTGADTVKLEALWELSDDYISDYFDSTRYYAERGYHSERQTSHRDREPQFLFTPGEMYKPQDNYPFAIDYYFQAKNIWSKIGSNVGEANAELYISEVYTYQSNCRLPLEYYHKA